MLGQMVVKYFGSKNFTITEFNHRINEDNIFDIIREINQEDDAIVINCIGKIKQKTNDAFTLLWSNSILPMELNRSLKSGHFLVQPSTDCVFSGNKGSNYSVEEFNDAEDIYGWSKSLGEQALHNRPKTLILRVSIIGPDCNSDKGLLSWFLNLKDGSAIKGYTNHLWNGITTLEWCKFVENYISNNAMDNFRFNTIQLGTKETHTKFEMLNIFKDCYNKHVEINPVAEGVNINKCLIPDVEIKPLLSQIIDLVNFENAG